MITPDIASRMIRPPSVQYERASAAPSTAGMFSPRAMMAEWEVAPPISATIPSTCSRSSVAVSLGKRSCTTRITLPGRWLRLFCSSPRSSRRRRLRKSRKSAARPEKRGSSISANSAMYSRKAMSTAHSAVYSFEEMPSRMSPSRASSCKSSLCARKISALSFCTSSKEAKMASSSSRAAACAFSNS